MAKKYIHNNRGITGNNVFHVVLAKMLYHCMSGVKGTKIK
jgi:hypothetical protein